MERPMQIDLETRIQELGQEFAKARRLFRRLGVDIHSQGQLTVGAACDQAGISFKDFTRTLAAMTPGSGIAPTIEDWASAPVADLIEHIQTRHHTFTRQELARLGGMLDQAVGEFGEQVPELQQIQGHFRALEEDLTQHLDAEDKVIFPAILKGSEAAGTPVFGTLEDLHRMALKEHEAVEELFQNIGIITRNFSLPLGAPPLVRSLYLGLRDLEEDLFMHIYLENHLLFPRSVQTSSSVK
jgi:regulator of cell morphogenesis and NO signaling